MNAPSIVAEDRRATALAKAARVRERRLAIFGQLRNGEVAIADVFTMGESDEVIANTKLLPCVESLPGVGKVEARRALDSVDIEESAKIAMLGDTQRESLLKVLP